MFIIVGEPERPNLSARCIKSHTNAFRPRETLCHFQWSSSAALHIYVRAVQLHSNSYLPTIPGFPGLYRDLYIPLSRYPGSLRLYPGSLVRVYSRCGCGVLHFCCVEIILPKARVMREAYISAYTYTYTYIHVHLEYVRARFTSPADPTVIGFYNTEIPCTAGQKRKEKK